jgi:membrane-bound lytic murein transglycosylase B
MLDLEAGQRRLDVIGRRDWNGHSDVVASIAGLLCETGCNLSNFMKVLSELLREEFPTRGEVSQPTFS